MSRSSSPSARKSLGQHFLHDTSVLDQIADAVGARDDELVLEIGPGTGQLTEALSARYRNVVALEIDERMIRHCERRFRDTPNVTIVPGDARDVDLATLTAGHAGYRVVGNLPYFAANPIIRRLLELQPKPRDIVVMVQREVAQELAAAPGDFSILAIAVQVYATTELLFSVPPTAFDPPPKVVSAVVRLTPRDEPLVPPGQTVPFFTLVRRTFKNPRKQIHNSLDRSMLIEEGTAHAVLARAGIEPSLRPERLSIEDWLRLLDVTEEAHA